MKLKTQAMELLAALRAAPPRNTGTSLLSFERFLLGVDPSLYPAAPFLPKATWAEIGRSNPTETKLWEQVIRSRASSGKAAVNQLDQCAIRLF